MRGTIQYLALLVLFNLIVPALHIEFLILAIFKYTLVVSSRSIFRNSNMNPKNCGLFMVKLSGCTLSPSYTIPHRQSHCSCSCSHSYYCCWPYCSPFLAIFLPSSSKNIMHFYHRYQHLEGLYWRTYLLPVQTVFHRSSQTSCCGPSSSSCSSCN